MSSDDSWQEDDRLYSSENSDEELSDQPPEDIDVRSMIAGLGRKRCRTGSTQSLSPSPSVTAKKTHRCNPLGIITNVYI